MSHFSFLCILDYPIYTGRNCVNPVIMTIFRETDKRSFRRSLVDRNKLFWGEPDDEEKTMQEYAYLYEATVAKVKDRLEVMGFSLRNVIKEFEYVKAEVIEDMKEWGEWDFINTKIETLQKATFENFKDAFKDIIEKKLTSESYSKELLGDKLPLIKHILTNDDDYSPLNFPCQDFRSFLRLLVEVCPSDSLVSLDYTDLVIAN
ncbi:MAG TPA: HEPN/Toprim-associated domain-containing protein [Thermodesulfobacteriota bacterium]|nr:HEPN/Toprim-associated domain-containing protein [Thermodesulfobacteriota bacterium]